MAIHAIFQRHYVPVVRLTVQGALDQRTVQLQLLAQELEGHGQALAVGTVLHQGGVGGGCAGRAGGEDLHPLPQQRLQRLRRLCDRLPHIGGGELLGLLLELGAFAAEGLRLIGVGQQDLHDALRPRLRVEGDGVLRHAEGGGGGVVIGLLNERGDVVLILVEIGDVEHRLRRKLEQGLLQLRPDGAGTRHILDGTDLLLGAAVGDGDAGLIVFHHWCVVVFDEVHRVGADGGVQCHLQAGVVQIALHVPGVVDQADHAALRPLVDEVEDVVHQVLVGLRLEHPGVVGGDRVLRVVGDHLIGALQHGGAAAQPCQNRQQHRRRADPYHSPSYVLRAPAPRPPGPPRRSRCRWASSRAR